MHFVNLQNKSTCTLSNNLWKVDHTQEFLSERRDGGESGRDERREMERKFFYHIECDLNDVSRNGNKIFISFRHLRVHFV